MDFETLTDTVVNKLQYVVNTPNFDVQKVISFITSNSDDLDIVFDILKVYAECLPDIDDKFKLIEALSVRNYGELYRYKNSRLTPPVGYAYVHYVIGTIAKCAVAQELLVNFERDITGWNPDADLEPEFTHFMAKFAMIEDKVRDVIRIHVLKSTFSLKY